MYIHHCPPDIQPGIVHRHRETLLREIPGMYASFEPGSVESDGVAADLTRERLE